MKKGILSVLAVVMAACMLFTACGDKTINLSKVESDEMQFAAPQSGDTVATIKTSKGDIKVILYPKYAPLAVENFTTHDFEGIPYSIPADYDTFLRRQYGNYMQLPPEEQRVGRHHVTGLDFGDYKIRYK